MMKVDLNGRVALVTGAAREGGHAGQYRRHGESESSTFMETPGV
ncbi:MAG: hypothetical protein Q8O40_00795 [Chloroflexota bacterium]|nr:hypothetical protein [Chloroflexota bacterium]